jgi:hypothetical protein
MDVLQTRAMRALVVATLAASLLVPGVAHAATARMYVNAGIKKARLGNRDTTAAARIGRVRKKARDRSYAGRTVWVRYFGPKDGGKYALEMYSNKSRKVFAFVINHPMYVTSNGVRVGMSEADLKAVYGSALSGPSGSVYNMYTLGGGTGTDFYCKDGRLVKIVIRKY